MGNGSEGAKTNQSDKLIETIERASRFMDIDDYAYATGLDKEFIYSILKGEIEEVDEETFKKLSLLH